MFLHVTKARHIADHRVEVSFNPIFRNLSRSQIASTPPECDAVM
jgi:hypothetical protein